MLLLTGPFGWDAFEAVHISLLGVPQDKAAFERVLLSFSCYPPAIPRIHDVIQASARYDCYIQTTWFREGQRRVTRQLAAIGVRLKVNERLKRSYCA